MNERAWLIDKSALARLSRRSELESWSNRVERGLVHVSNVTRLEIGYSARSGDAARRQFAETPLAAMPVEYLTPMIEDRALEVQILLTDKGFRHHCDRDRVVRNVAHGATMSRGQ